MELPPQWAVATLGEVADWGSGGTPKSGVARYYGGEIPWVVSGDLKDGVITHTPSTLTSDGLQESSAKWIPEGAIMIAMYGATIGKLGIAGQPLTTNQAVASAVPKTELLNPRYLFWYLWSQREAFRRAGKGGAQPNISQVILKSWPIPLPPLAEQQRIVVALEEQIPRLDAAERDLGTALRKVSSFRKAVLLTLVPEHSPDSWEVTTVEAAGSIRLGRQRHPDWHHGPEMHPYLRVANVFEDRIDTDDVMEMDFSGIFERYKLEPGDVLLNEGQSPHLVGRPALYRGHPANVAFTNSLLRFRARPDVLPEWALMVFRRHLHARRFMREVRITTNIAHLSAKRLKGIEFPIPPLPEQKRLVQRCGELLTHADSLEKNLNLSLRRALSLRRSLLNCAFTGALVPNESTDESVKLLLDQIRLGQTSPKGAKAVRGRSPRGRVARLEAEGSPSSLSDGSPPPRNADQQEFEL
ncbi:restriction endonuclease subunit S [Kribbella sp. CA-294648]|uniref:restriction endonuclease subunit S n=1 Tax=Kribbella sp. CA-294648 TaxID=3239948 RepID=UPI003D89BFB7